MHSVLGMALLRSSSAVMTTVRGAAAHTSFGVSALKAASFATFANTEATWNALFDSPSEWEDLRPLKAAGGNPKMPDFSQKGARGSDGERPPALWIDSKGTPAWVADKLPSLEVAAAVRNAAGQARPASGGDEAQWQSLFDNPSEWEDVRPIKAAGANPRLPDFRKLGGIIGEKSPALWIDSKGVPSWVADKLPSLHVEPAVAKQARSGSTGSGTVGEDLWQSLFSNPAEWEDVRPVKATGANPRLPDFRKANRVIGEKSPALWIDSKGVPGWVADKLPSLHVSPAAQRSAAAF